jgi:ubiquinone/menaquinone biosynthesis C-methylase UbiE
MFSDPVNNVSQFRLGEGMAVADLGAGSGAYTIAAADVVGETGRVYAVEVQRDLASRIANLSKAKGLFNVEVIWGDVERVGGTKLAENTLDAVIAGNLFFLIDEKQALVYEIARILRPGGKVLIVDWLDAFEGIGPPPDRVTSAHAMRRLFEAEGLACSETIHAGAHHWGIICRKM